MIQPTSSKMLNFFHSEKQNNQLPVDVNTLANAVENKRNPEDNRSLEKPVNSSVSSQSSLLSTLKQRASQLMVEAEVLVQQIGLATKEQIPGLTKKLKQITNDLKQIASRHNAMKSGSNSIPAISINSTGLSISTSITDSSMPAITNLTPGATETKLLQTENRGNIQTKAINIYESVKHASSIDDPIENEVTNNTLKNADTKNSTTEGEEYNDDFSSSLQQLQELLKLAGELLKRRVNEIEDSDERKAVEEILRDVKSDMSDIDHMIGYSDVSVLSGASTNHPEISNLAINVTPSLHTITDVNTSILSGNTSLIITA